MRALEFKVLLLGHVEVGKTSFMQRYCYGKFCSHYKTTVGVDYGVRTVERRTIYQCTLQLCDISGQERFAQLTRVFYKGATGALILFDLHDASTLERALDWKRDLDEKLPGIPALLVGNKCDLDTAVPHADVAKMCTDGGFRGHINTSAKRDINVDVAVSHLLDCMLDKSPPTPRTPVQTPRGAQHQYPDRPSPRKPQPIHIVGPEEWRQEEDEDNECCWVL